MIRVKKLRGGERVTRAKVFVNGRRVRTLRGKRLTAPVNLRNLPKGKVRVRIEALTNRKRLLKSSRTYRTCVPRRTSAG